MRQRSSTISAMCFQPVEKRRDTTKSKTPNSWSASSATGWLPGGTERISARNPQRTDRHPAVARGGMLTNPYGLTPQLYPGTSSTAWPPTRTGRFQGGVYQQDVIYECRYQEGGTEVRPTHEYPPSQGDTPNENLSKSG